MTEAQDIRLNWRLKELLRFGVVTQTDESKALVRVQFTDMDGMLSYWLPVLHHKTLNDKQYWMPDIGEHVVCLMDENAEEGVVIGAIYSTSDVVPVSSKDKYYVRFNDGTVIEYDRAAHRLTADVKGDIKIKITGKCDADVQGTVTVKSTSNIILQAPSINIMSYTGGSSAGYITGDFNIIGNLNVEGNIHATGSIIDDGGNTNNHSH